MSLRMRKYYIIVYLAVALVLVVSCSKEEREDNRMSDIMGTWELVHLTDNVAGQTWTFTNDSIPTVTVDYENAGSVSNTYFITLEDYKYYISLDDLNRYFIDGKYLIMTLTDELLIMERVHWSEDQHPFNRKEFVRVSTSSN